MRNTVSEPDSSMFVIDLSLLVSMVNLMATNAGDHPIFGRLAQGPKSAIDAITERRVEQARAEGLFDDLPGAGKPIPDIDVQRPSGWFANRLVAKERSKLAATRLDEFVRKSKPKLWRLATVGEVELLVADINAQIADHNRRHPAERVQRMDLAATVATWRRVNGPPPATGC